MEYSVEQKYEKMKTPLGYQVTEYDCGQVTFLNAMKYLFYTIGIIYFLSKNAMKSTQK